MLSRRGLLAAALTLPVGAAALSTSVGAVAGESAPMTVYKSPSCGCCGAWVDHMRAAGFEVTVKEVEDLAPVKLMAGVPAELQSCHTASLDGYVFEGHVPAETLRRFLAERPDADGLAVPAMPVGSPGMEGPGAQPYEVLSFDREGRATVYETVRP